MGTEHRNVVVEADSSARKIAVRSSREDRQLSQRGKGHAIAVISCLSSRVRLRSSRGSSSTTFSASPHLPRRGRGLGPGRTRETYHGPGQGVHVVKKLSVWDGGVRPVSASGTGSFGREWSPPSPLLLPGLLVEHPFSVINVRTFLFPNHHDY